MNKLAHTLVLTVFSATCWFLWAILTLSAHVTPHGHAVALPAFTAFLVSLRPLILLLPLLAAAYYFFAMFRKSERKPSWVAFFATSMSVALLVMLPTLVAAYLPLVAAVQTQ
jgi:hypothetical protein